MIDKLHVIGDDNIITNATIEELTVNMEVSNLTLYNVKDSLNSVHNFNGGGSNSINLTGETSLQGQIVIESEKPVQIRTDQKNNDKMITGTILVKSEAILSLPVENVVINDATTVTINHAVKNLVAKENVTIKLADNIEQEIKTRHGVTVTVNDSQGKVMTDNFTVKEVLDDSEITWYLSVAQNYLDHSKFGDQHGEYSKAAKDSLVKAMDDAEKELQEAQKQYEEDQSKTESLQVKIDNATLKIEKSIDALKSSRVYVNLSDLYLSLDKARIAIHSVSQENLIEQFSKAEVTTLQKLVKDTENLLFGLNNYTQATIDNQTQQLDAQVEMVKDSWKGDEELNPFNLETVSLQILGAGITKNTGEATILEDLGEDGFGFGNNIISTSHLIDGGIQYDIRTAKNAPIKAFIQTNNHLVIKEFTTEEIEQGTVKKVVIDETYVPLGIKVAGLDEKDIPEKQQIRMMFTTENKRSPRMIYVPLGTKVESGTYDVLFEMDGKEAIYSLSKMNATIDKNNPNIVFSDDETAKVGFELEGTHNGNVDLEYITIYSGLTEVFKDIIFYNKEYNQFIINQGEYFNIQTSYLFEKNLKQWKVNYNTNTVTIDADKFYNYNDELKVTSDYFESEITLDSKVRQSVSIMDKYNNRVNILAERDNGSFTVVDATVIIHKDDKEYSKTLPMHEISQTSIKDIVGDANLSGEVTLEIHIDNPPFDIAPYIEKIDIVKPADN